MDKKEASELEEDTKAILNHLPKSFVLRSPQIAQEVARRMAIIAIEALRAHEDKGLQETLKKVKAALGQIINEHENYAPAERKMYHIAKEALAELNEFMENQSNG